MKRVIIYALKDHYLRNILFRDHNLLEWLSTLKILCIVRSIIDHKLKLKIFSPSAICLQAHQMN